MKDYYKILEVSQSATQDEIKKAYRKLALLYHPDRNDSPHAQTLIQEINLAYDLIGDAKKRAAYDLRFKNYKTYPGSSNPSGQKKKQPRPAPRRTTSLSERFDYKLWANRGRFVSAFILFYSSMLCLDYYISSEYKNTVIQSYDVTTYRGKRSVSHYDFVVQSSKVDFEMSSEAHLFNVGDTLNIDITPFFGIVKTCDRVIDNTPREMQYVISLYSPIMFFVVLMMALNIAAIVIKNNPQSFNLSLGNIIFFTVFCLIRWLA